MNKKYSIFARVVLLTLTSVCMLSNVFAESITASKLVETTVETVQKTVEQKAGSTPPQELDKILRDIISPVFDFEEMSKRCLGSNWKTATPEQQAEFQKLFSNLLAKNYIKQIREKAKGSKFRITSANETADKAVVQSVVTTEGGDLKIDYRLYNKPGQWKVYDVIVENIGLVSNYRSEFSDIVNKDGVAGLIEKLKNK